MIYVVGIGSGSYGQITPEVMQILKSCDAVVGYDKYVDMVRDYVGMKILYTSKMGQEVDRCKMALMFAQDFGKTVAVVSSGDAGVYGMAGLMLEVAEGSGEEVRIVPGVTAANACAAVLGAPLMNDYVTISLSDYLNDWRTIANRLVCACLGDFVICLYNPASRHRPGHFRHACNILLEHKSPDTPAGYVRNAGREGQESRVTTLGEIMNCNIDMSCTVIIGNSKSYISDGKIITPRGYGQVIKIPQSGNETGGQSLSYMK